MPGSGCGGVFPKCCAKPAGGAFTGLFPGESEWAVSDLKKKPARLVFLAVRLHPPARLDSGSFRRFLVPGLDSAVGESLRSRLLFQGFLAFLGKAWYRRCLCVCGDGPLQYVKTARFTVWLSCVSSVCSEWLETGGVPLDLELGL